MRQHRAAPAKRRAARADLTEVLNGFRRILRALRQAAGETQARFEISAAQLFVLDELHGAGRALSINELAELTMTDRSSVANVVDRLAQSGRVTREQAQEDRRRAEVRITAAGARLARAAPPAPTMRLLSGLRALGPAELRGLARGLARLQEEMALLEEPAPMLFEEPVRAATRRRKGRSPLRK